MTLANMSVNPSSHTSHSDRDARSERTEQQLEAADRGIAAWRILCAAFMFEAVLFGSVLSLPSPIWHTTSLFLNSTCSTDKVPFRFLGIIRCVSELLCRAPRVQG